MSKIYIELRYVMTLNLGNFRIRYNLSPSTYKMKNQQVKGQFMLKDYS
jgi:hypothetical protein